MNTKTDKQNKDILTERKAMWHNFIIFLVIVGASVVLILSLMALFLT